MARIILRIFLVFLGLVALGIGWVAGARPLSLLLDRFHTVEIESRPVLKLGLDEINGGMIRINDVLFDTAAPDYGPGPVRMRVNQKRQLVFESSGQAIVLGEGTGSLGTIKPGAGETARFKISRSLLSWPTPFEMNFMTGVSPSWKRHLYYRLVWQGPGGGRLEMVWRYEQWFYQDWASGFMTRAGTTGLVHAEVRP